MSASKRPYTQTPKDTLERNPGIDATVVEQFGKLERALKKLGVEIKPTYGIEPPFGRNRAPIHNRSRK